MGTVTRNGHLVGYARVGTGHQTLDGQHDTLETGFPEPLSIKCSQGDWG
ncbi:hypothetical protein [Rhodococcus sp. 008]|nr:hypothetical protein [Rhodococcus sp. 008]